MSTKHELLDRVSSHPDRCEDVHCLVCSVRDCPHKSPFHYHADGCPQCVRPEARVLELYGTQHYPIHPSGIRRLATCPWEAASMFLSEVASEEGGVAGDTGSAFHAAIAAFHNGKGVADSVAEMRAKLANYPQADLQDAAGLFLMYATDSRNQGAKVCLNEEPITYTLQAAPEDHTQTPITIIGTVDQVRRDSNHHRPRVYDAKTTKKGGYYAQRQSIFQMAAYCAAASIRLGEPVDPGALILPRLYKPDGSGNVFWYYPWTFEDVPQILAVLRHRVADIRAGRLWHMPTDNCDWCHFKTPDVCLPRLQTTLKVLR